MEGDHTELDPRRAAELKAATNEASRNVTERLRGLGAALKPAKSFLPVHVLSSVRSAMSETSQAIEAASAGISADLRTTLESVREVTSDPTFQRQYKQVMDGLQHPDPVVRAQWQRISNAFSIGEFRNALPLADVPGVKGRRPGSGMERVDAPLVMTLNIRGLEGERRADVARELAQLAAGGGTPESRATRLLKAERLLRGENK